MKRKLYPIAWASRIFSQASEFGSCLLQALHRSTPYRQVLINTVKNIMGTIKNNLWVGMS